MSNEAGLGRGVRDGLSAGWCWWSEELAAAFPRVAAWLAGKGSTATIRLGAQQTDVLVYNRPGSVHEVSVSWPVALADLENEQASELGRLCEGCEIDLMLPGRAVHRMSTWLPRAAAATTEAVRYALMDSAPLSVDKMAFDWRLVSPLDRAPERGWLEVDVVLCREATLDALAAGLARCSLMPTRMGVGESEPSTGLAFTLRRCKRSKANWIGTQRRKLLLGLALTVFSTGLLITALCARWQEHTVRRELARLEAQHRESVPLAQRQARLEAIKATVARASSEVPASAVLDELARLTPLKAWLLELRLEGGRLKVVGRAGNPTGLAGAFAQSPVIHNVRLEAVNASAGPDAGVAEFDLSATTRGSR